MGAPIRALAAAQVVVGRGAGLFAFHAERADGGQHLPLGHDKITLGLGEREPGGEQIGFLIEHLDRGAQPGFLLKAHAFIGKLGRFDLLARGLHRGARAGEARPSGGGLLLHAALGGGEIGRRPSAGALLARARLITRPKIGTDTRRSTESWCLGEIVVEIARAIAGPKAHARTPFARPGRTAASPARSR